MLTFTCVLPVVFPTALVPAHHAGDLLPVLVFHHRAFAHRRGRCRRRGAWRRRVRAAGDGARVSPGRVEGHVVVHPRLPKPGGPGPQEPGLDILPADLASCHHLSVIMNYDLIPARPRAPPGHCTPRHLDRQCHRTGLRWLPLQQGTSSCYLPARRPTGSPVPLPPLTRDERDQILGVGSRWNRWNQGRGGGATTEAGNPEKKQLVLRAVAGGGCGVG